MALKRAASLARRLDQLSRRQRKPCAECGDDGSPPRYTFTWAASEDPPAESQWCTACGRQTVVVFKWPWDLDDAHD